MTVVLVAGALLMFMGFAALAVDWGAGVVQRRQDQNAVDFGALAAVQQARVDFVDPACAAFSGAALARCNGAEEAMRIVDANVDLTVDWTIVGCDPTPLANLAPQTDCISFNSNNTEARVFVDDVDVGAFFGTALGVTEIETVAAAQAGGISAGGGATLPFYLDPTNAGNNEACLKSQASSVAWGECDPAVGEYGYADFFFFGTSPNTTPQCGGPAPNRIEAAIAIGVDHGLETNASDPPDTPDIDICQDAPLTNSDGVKTQTGVAAAVLDAGFIDGGSQSFVVNPYDGRIEDPGGYEVKSSRFINNSPLWDHFTSCPGSPSLPTNHVEALSCLDNWTSGVIFDTSIGNDRLGLVPELFSNPVSFPSVTDFAFKDFKPVYLNRTFYKCNSTTCEIVHVPGVADTGSCGIEPLDTCGTVPALADNNSRKLSAISAYVLDLAMLPESVRNTLTGDLGEITYNLTR